MVEADSYITPSIPIGFTFNFEGVAYTDFKASSNGFLSFGTSTSSQTGNNLGGVTAASRPLVAPLWDDLDGRATGGSTASFIVTGTAPNRVFTYEWLNWEWNWQSNNPVISFQVKLYETTDVIEFVYRQETGAVNNGSASIGIAGASTFLSLDNTSVSPLANNITETDNLSVKPVTGQVYTFTPPTCISPGSLTAANITATSVDLGWTSAASLWDVEWGTAGFTQGAGSMITGTTTNPHNLIGLTPGTTYDFYVRADCGAVDGVSTWTGPFNFTTLVTCVAPTALTAANITTTSADLGWTSAATTWDVEWGATGFTQGAGTMVTGTTTNPHTLTTLASSTTYDFYVRADCGAVNGVSTWTGPFSFTTVCTVNTTFPYTENFDALIPNNASIFSCITTDNLTGCWTNDVGNPNMWTARSLATSSASTGPTTDNTSGTGNYVFLETSGCANTSHLYSRAMDFTSLTTPQMSFFYHMFGTNMGSLDVFASIDGGATWSASLWTQSGNQGDSWINGTVDLNAYTANTNVIIRFSGITNAHPSDIGLDDVTFEQGPPPCVAPTVLTATNITATSADLGWTSTVALWDVEWGTTGFTQGAGTIVTGTTTNPHALTTLTSGTTYDFYVRADCSVNSSAWVGPFSFTTTVVCTDPSALAANNITTTSADLAWTENGTATTWDVEWGTAGFAQGAGTMVTGASNPQNVNTLTAATAYEFYVRADCGAVTGVSAWVGPFAFTTSAVCVDPSALAVNNITTTSADLAWTENGTATTWDVEWGTAGFAQGAGTMVTGATNPQNVNTLTAATAYEFYVRADCGVNSSAWVGPFSFTTIAVCVDPSALVANNITATTADLAWTENGTATTWDIEYDTTGFTPTGTPTVTGTTTNPHNLTGLTDATSYDFYIRANCGVNLSAWVGPMSFNTLSVGVDEISNNLSLTIYPNPNTGVFTLNINTIDVKELNIKIMNLQGQMVYSKNNFDNIINVNEQIDLSNNAKGVYFVNVTSDKGVQALKVLVQ